MDSHDRWININYKFNAPHHSSGHLMNPIVIRRTLTREDLLDSWETAGG